MHFRIPSQAGSMQNRRKTLAGQVRMLREAHFGEMVPHRSGERSSRCGHIGRLRRVSLQTLDNIWDAQDKCQPPSAERRHTGHLVGAFHHLFQAADHDLPVPAN